MTGKKLIIFGPLAVLAMFGATLLMPQLETVEPATVQAEAAPLVVAPGQANSGEVAKSGSADPFRSAQRAAEAQARQQQLRAEAAELANSSASNTKVYEPQPPPKQPKKESDKKKDKKKEAPTTGTTSGSVATEVAVKTTGKGKSSDWDGKELVHPDGDSLRPEVLRWAKMVKKILRDHDLPKKYLPGVLAQMQSESGGNPSIVNTWDSNAAKGIPSKGLMQVIAPTYLANAHPDFRSLEYHTDPYANVWAALNYVKNRYGESKLQEWNEGKNTGY